VQKAVAQEFAVKQKKKEKKATATEFLSLDVFPLMLES